MPVEVGNKEIRSLIRDFKPGYYVEQSGGGHYIVYGPNNRPVRMVDGRPLTLPSTPHLSRIIEKRMSLERHGVIETEQERLLREIDDKIRASGAPTSLSSEVGGTGDRVLHAGPESPVDDNAERSRSLRDRLPNGITNQEFAEVSGSPLTDVANLYLGGVLNAEQRRPLENLASQLEIAEDPVVFFFDLLRRKRGLHKDQPTVTPEPIKVVTEQVVEMEAGTAADLPTGIADKVQNLVQDLQQEKTRLQVEIDQIDVLLANLNGYVTGQTFLSDTGVGVEPVRETPAAAAARPAPKPEQAKTGAAASRYKGNPVQISQQIRQAVADLVGQGGEWNIHEIMELVEASDSAVRNALKNLINDGKVVVIDAGKPGPPASGGRPPTYGSSQVYPAK